MRTVAAEAPGQEATEYRAGLERALQQQLLVPHLVHAVLEQPETLPGGAC